MGIDGNVAVVGDVFDDGDGSGSGAAYLYSVGDGSQLSKLTPSDGVFNDSFGNAVGVSGNVAIVGAPPHNSGAGSNSGAAYLYDVNTGDELFKLVPSDASSETQFGWSVAISGNYALVGAPFDGGGFQIGSAYVFNVTTGAADWQAHFAECGTRQPIWLGCGAQRHDRGDRRCRKQTRSKIRAKPTCLTF